MNRQRSLRPAARALPIRRPRGATAVVVALSLLALGGMMALSLNVGHLMMVRGQLQNACDAAALAGAAELDHTYAGLDRARAVAIDYASRHWTDNTRPVLLNAADVLFGTYDASTRAFTPVSESAPNAAGLINAVQVVAGRESARGNPMDVFFSPFSGGQRTADVHARAIAAKGAPCEGCSVPLLFAECLVMQANGLLNCGQKLIFNSDTVDNIGFTNLADGVHSVSTSGIIDILSGNCRTAEVGDFIGTSNGSNLNNNVVKAFNNFIVREGSQVVAPIVASPGGCPFKFNGLNEVVGFATFTITRVIGPPHPSIEIELKCDATTKSRTSGCLDFGTSTERAALVR